MNSIPYTAIEWYDIGFATNSEPLMVVRSLGTRYIRDPYPKGYVVPPPSDDVDW